METQIQGGPNVRHVKTNVNAVSAMLSSTLTGVARNFTSVVGGIQQQKPLQEPGIFQLFSDICSFFTKRQCEKGGTPQ